MRSATEIYTEKIYIYWNIYIWNKIIAQFVSISSIDLEPIISAKVPIIFLFYWLAK